MGTRTRRKYVRPHRNLPPHRPCIRDGPIHTRAIRPDVLKGLHGPHFLLGLLRRLTPLCLRRRLFLGGGLSLGGLRTR